MSKTPLDEGFALEAFPSTTSSQSLSRAGSEITLRIQPGRGLFNLDLRAVWEFRELLYFLVWRDVKVRYKQTVMGAIWAILQPVLTMLMFVAIGSYANLASDRGSPYSIFIYAALLPMTYFTQAISRSGLSLVTDSNLIRKVYFPRLIIPLAAATAPLVDFCVSFGVIVAMIGWYRVPLHWPLLTLPIFLLLAVATALAVGLWLSALNARYRDVGHTIPFLTQIWFFASPVFYSPTIFPEKWRLLYGLNPMVGVIDGFRWALLGKQAPALGPMVLSTAVVVILLLSGIVFFKRMEQILADVL
jgi:lipopolysaccharide transport system permease protein